MSNSIYKKANAQHYSSGVKEVQYEQAVDHCPYCKSSLSHNPNSLVYSLPVNEMRSNVISFKGEGRLFGFFQCLKNECQEGFIAEYEYIYDVKSEPRQMYVLKRTIPFVNEKKHWPAEINNISTSFSEIFNQSLNAEGQNLSHICGPGYRKALEFLIKDYCIYKNVDKTDEIKSMLLGDCIKKFIKDESIKACAQRAAWLGNDETHYVRRWDKKDIADLKILIQLTVNHVQTEILTNKYIEEMK